MSFLSSFLKFSQLLLIMQSPTCSYYSSGDKTGTPTPEEKTNGLSLKLCHGHWSMQFPIHYNSERLFPVCMVAWLIDQ